jgi:hypothetical protein
MAASAGAARSAFLPPEMTKRRKLVKACGVLIRIAAVLRIR